MDGQLNAEMLRDMYRQMLLIRRFEEKAGEMYARGRIGGFLHLYIGEEAVAVGAIAALRPQDHLITHYRDHGYPLAKGTSPRAVMAELFGKATGTSKGKGGSMHIVDAERFFWGGHAIVGAHLPLAVGLGLSAVYLKEDRVVLAIFGDGATDSGDFHQAMNLAALWRLPVIFLCENNLYGMGVPIRKASAVTDISRKAIAYDMPGLQCDGMNVLAVHDTVEQAIERAVSGQGPSLVEVLTYRFRGHSAADPQLYRTKEEIARWQARDPVMLFPVVLEEQGLLTSEQRQAIEQEVEETVDDAVRFAEESPEPAPEVLYEDVYSEPTPSVILAH
jgi:pyruvate dehydrogenase E1 component alpha subunit